LPDAIKVRSELADIDHPAKAGAVDAEGQTRSHVARGWNSRLEWRLWYVIPEAVTSFGG
jgi:hypothetical protein